MNILLIEPDELTSKSMRLMLNSQPGITVVAVDNGIEGYERAANDTFHIIVMDVNLPDMSGYTLLNDLRQRGIATPVLIVSGLAGVQDIVTGLWLGADGYITKPFHKDWFIAQIHAITRRTDWGLKIDHSLYYERLAINTDTQNVSIDGKGVKLTPREYDLLALLVWFHGDFVPQDKIMDYLYPDKEQQPDKKIIDVLSSKIRSKIVEHILEAKGLSEQLSGLKNRQRTAKLNELVLSNALTEEEATGYIQRQYKKGLRIPRMQSGGSSQKPSLG